MLTVTSSLGLSGATTLTAAVQAPVPVVSCAPAVLVVTVGVQAPQVDITSGVEILTDPLALTASVQAPGVSLSPTWAATVLTVTASVQAPGVDTGELIVSPTVLSVTTGVQAPGFTVALSPAVLVLTATAPTPSVFSWTAPTGTVNSEDGRGYSHDLWDGFPVEEILFHRNANAGCVVKPNLASFQTWADAAAPTVLFGPGGRGYVSTGAGVAGYAANMGGGIHFSAGSASAEECSFQWGGGAFSIDTTVGYDRDLIFEIALKQSYIDLSEQRIAWFVGLASAGAAAEGFLTAGVGLADVDLIGFYCPSDDDETVDFVYRAQGQSLQTPALDFWTAAEHTWVHFGFKFNRETYCVVPWYGTGDRSTSPMVDYKMGRISPTQLQTATFPGGEGLTPIVAAATIGDDSGDLYVRFLACAQRAAKHRE